MARLQMDATLGDPGYGNRSSDRVLSRCEVAVWHECTCGQLPTRGGREVF